MVVFWQIKPYELTKLFGIEKIPFAKDSGKVLIIIIYCFYNYFIFCFPGVFRWYSGGVQGCSGVFRVLHTPLILACVAGFLRLFAIIDPGLPTASVVPPGGVVSIRTA